jgi:Tfp pilus assembly protein PilN
MVPAGGGTFITAVRRRPCNEHSGRIMSLLIPMKAQTMIKKATSLVRPAAQRLVRAGKTLGKVLSFSLADERIAPGQCLSVHLDDGAVFIAYGSRSLSRVQIEGIRHYPLEAGKYPAPEALASTLHLALNDLKALMADITLIVPKAWTIVKTADFPLIVKGTLSSVVSYELDRLTPLGAEKAYYDYQVIGENQSRLQIMLAVIKAEALDPYLHALEQKGIRVRRVVVSLSALGALSHHVHGGKTTLFVDGRPGRCEGGVIDEGRLTASFTEGFPSDAERTRVVAAAVNPLIEALKNGGKAPALVVNGPAGAWPLLTETVHAPVWFLGETDLKLRFLHPEKAVPHTALGGVLESLQGKLRGSNLLDKGIHQPARTPVALTLVLVIALASLGMFSLAASLQIETKKMEAIEHEIAVREPEVRKIDAVKKETAALEKEINTVEQFKTTKPIVLDLLKELTQVLPKNAWLARVRIAEAALNIEGFAGSATDILPKLEASRYFKKVEFASPTYRDPRMNMDRFVIKMEIEGFPEEKGKNE